MTEAYVEEVKPLGAHVQVPFEAPSNHHIAFEAKSTTPRSHVPELGSAAIAGAEQPTAPASLTVVRGAGETTLRVAQAPVSQEHHDGLQPAA